jgi:hypothetical protein
MPDPLTIAFHYLSVSVDFPRVPADTLRQRPPPVQRCLERPGPDLHLAVALVPHGEYRTRPARDSSQGHF